MKCIYPERLPIREDGRVVDYLYIPCGHCPACQENYKNDWAVRVKHELSSFKDSVFLTLTYNDVHLSLQNLEYDNGYRNSVEKKELSDFLKRLRRRLGVDKIRFFACGEYGDEKYTHRPHYHILIFGISNENDIFKDKNPVYRKGKIDHYYIEHWPVWPHGQVEVSAQIPNENSAKYITKYIAKNKDKNTRLKYEYLRIKPEFLQMSRRPGIGYYGILKHAKFYMSHPYGVIGKSKVKLSRYIIEKVEECTDTDFGEYIKSEYKSGGVRDTRNVKIQKEKNIVQKYKK